MTPGVSVVMGVHNGAQYLRETVECILNQERVDLEFIIVNDGSNDETRDILSDYAATDSRVRVQHQQRAGLTRALIAGSAMARGSYIARQDNGDISLPGRLLAQTQALDADETISFVSCWTEFCGPGSEFLYCAKGQGKASAPISIISETARHGVIDGPSSHPSVMFRRDAYVRAGGYRPQFYYGQDWDLWYRLAEAGRFQMIERVLYRARVMPNSVSGRSKPAQEAIAVLSHEAMIRRRRGLPEGDLLQKAESIRPAGRTHMSKRLEARGLYFIGEQLRRNGDARAEFYLREALKTFPLFLKPWLRLGQLRLQIRF